MTIAIDCRFINASGIGVYLKGCLPWFLKSNNSFFLIGNKEQLKLYSLYNNVSIIDCNIKPFSVKELFFFPSYIKKQINKTDFFYSPYFNIPSGLKVPVFTTIHDIIFPDMPEITSKIGLFARMWFYRRAYKKSKKIFTVSEFSKSRIEHHLGTSKPVIVTYSAIGQAFLEYRKNIHNIKKKETIIFIGNIKKHKGLECLLEAYSHVKKEGLNYKLIIIGNKDNFRSSDNLIFYKIKEIGDDSVTFTGFLTDDSLMELLSEASLLVQPSLYEGFCLPPLEAIVLGTNVLISDIPVLKEIYKDFPVSYFQAGNPIDLKYKIIHILQDKNNTYPVLSNEQLLKYNFEKSTLTILGELN